MGSNRRSYCGEYSVAVPAVRSAKLTAPAEKAPEAIQDRPRTAIASESPESAGPSEGLQPVSTLPACGQVIQYAFPALPGYGASAAPWLRTSMPGAWSRGTGTKSG